MAREGAGFHLKLSEDFLHRTPPGTFVVIVIGCARSF